MDPPFGDAFRSHTFSEQTLMSTDLLANSSDPDFMYELVSNIFSDSLIYGKSVPVEFFIYKCGKKKKDVIRPNSILVTVTLVT